MLVSLACRREGHVRELVAVLFGWRHRGFADFPKKDRALLKMEMSGRAGVVWSRAPPDTTPGSHFTLLN
jgi:hypothetical protein